FRHERIHVSFLILFVVGVSLSVLLQIIPVLYLTKDHDGEQLHPRRVAYVKLYLLVLAVPVVVLFMITYAICHGTVPEGDARCDRVVSTAAVCDWAVAFILAVFFIAYTFDFLKSSAGKLNGHRLDETGSPSAQIAGLHHLDEEDSVAMEEARRQRRRRRCAAEEIMPTAEEHTQTIEDELEVLQSIYMDDELEKLSDEVLSIRITPDLDALTGEERAGAPTLVLQVTYTSEYPDALPELEIETVEGELDEGAPEQLLKSVKDMGEAECLGMAMVFTLASHLREELTTYLRRRVQEVEDKRQQVRDAEIEAEQQKFRGTAVTTERFAEWRKKFDAERAAAKAAEDDALMKGLNAKEKEEFRRMRNKLTGRQMFQRDGPEGKVSAVEELEGEEDDGEEVDWSLYTREARQGHRPEDDEDEGRIVIDLSDED
ncbi:unnamed protein product, partial [Tilletia controversa]